MRPSQPIYLRLSIHDGCNLRCTYCRPARDLRFSASRQGLTTGELVELVTLVDRVAPLRKLRLTGGEPLLRPDVLELVAGMRRALGKVEICMTTNGTLLDGLAADLRAAGLDRMNVSLDTVDPAAYGVLTRGGDLDRVLAGLAAARRAGFEDIKLNAVLLRSYNGASLAGLVRRAAGLGDEVRFIELMPISVAAGLHRAEFLSAGEAATELRGAFGPLDSLRGSDTAERYAIEVDGRRLEVGLIPSVSDPFCSSCDRLRLDCRGKLFACLRHPDWLDLGGPLKAGDPKEVRRRVKRVLDAKCAPEFIWPGRQMSAIGG